MQTYDLLTSMNGGLRELATQRWGLPATTPRLLAAMLVRPRAALRLIRRGSDAGAGQLTRLMVEYGGRPVPHHRVLEDEAARLRGWFPVIETAEGWALPADLAMAAIGAARVQRLFASTLVATLDGPALESLLTELEVPRFGSPASRAVRAATSIIEQEVDDDSAAAAQRSAELGAIDIERIAALAPVPGARGTRWRLETTDGDVLEIAPRELAAACDLGFAPPLRVGQPIEFEPDIVACSSLARAPCQAQQQPEGARNGHNSPGPGQNFPIHERPRFRKRHTPLACTCFSQGNAPFPG